MDLSKINFKELRQQKDILIRMIQSWGEADDEYQQWEAGEATGILQLIDAIQDHAVDKMGISENEIFGNKMPGV